MSKKSHTFAGTLSNKMESPVKQSLVSKVMAFHKQTSSQKTKSSQKIEKPLKQNNDKVELILQDYLYIYIICSHIYLCLIIKVFFSFLLD